jgi:cysteine desulfurase family protein (TIGR01976 family)
MKTKYEKFFCGRRSDFPSLKRRVNGHPVAYFDGPGGSQVPQSVMDAITWYYRTCNANVHGGFLASKTTDDVLEETRVTVADFLNASSSTEISFGANMTTLNFFLSWALGRLLSEGDEVVITQLDHEANRGPWLRLRDRGVNVREVTMQPDGTLDYQDFEAKVNKRTRLIAVGLASNSLGTVNDAAFVREAACDSGALLLYDAVHYAPHFPVDVAALGADFLLCSAYKFYGPHVGILYSRNGLLEQLNTDRLRTQDQRAPYRIETGTLNHACISGVKAAIEYVADIGEGQTLRSKVVSAMRKLGKHEYSLAKRLHCGLVEIEGLCTYGPGFEKGLRAPTVSFTLEGFAPFEAATRLGARGFQVWSGHFYAVKAVEVLGLENQGGLVRVGISMYNTREEVDRLLAEIRSLRGV